MIADWKKKKKKKKKKAAHAAMESDAWGLNFNDGTDPTRVSRVRTNPWHPNLDGKKFWM
ncbi:hypothetical protein HBI56_079500 [Parastagonospora nodorum]|nr:hypothetical protein HBH51_066600 [Parastagonospora nodorum]KAH4017162.1 hypothetical protein HBI09_197700 [Parastagonospora nodorum]KAH4049550.1 hypothetical protein HBH49_148170 [Parastagonospora nodorum]KAH4098619.1 hypothetical protein HBH46_155310 [Parastagonospora nodorum]KAH4122896.1 hypothetical protein HBH47_085770 [Parastagonospora nodorum]